MHILWPKTFANEVIDVFRRTLETGEPYLAPSLTEHRQDVDVVESYEWQIHRVTLADGQYGVVCYFFDTTRLRQAEHAASHLAAIVTSSEDAIISKDLDGVITSWNKGAERLFGYTAEEAVGQPVTLLIPQDHADEEPRILQRIRQGEVMDHYETVRRRKDGTLVDISLTVSPLKDSSGRIIGASKIARDNSERKQAEQALRESEERFRTLADNMSQFAWTADAKGWIYWYNQRWYDYTGTTLEEMQGWGWKKVHHPEHVDRVVQRVQRSWDTGEPWEDTFPLRGKNGEYRWFLSRALPIRDHEGDIVRWFGTNTDITERIELEEQVKQQAESLSDLHRRKDEFLAMLSHELRNPLAPISNAVQLLRLQKNEDQLQQQARSVIERQVGQLTRLVDDLLEVSRITTGRIHLHQERLALNGVVEHAVESVRPLIGQRRHALKLNLPPEPIWVYADAARLEQVVVNLLTNAAKYTDDGGHILLAVQQEGDEAVLRVRDSGVGIAPELLPRIFEIFTQAERSLDRSQGGLGIGLCLVQRLVEMHGGRVEAYSSLGQGSEFVVRLPVVLSAASSSTPSTEVDKPNGPSLRVLVVDDNVDAAHTLAMLLKMGGHDVRTAHDGPPAIEAALDYRPHVVLLDIGLPAMNGLEVAKRLRQKPELGNVVLVAMTGYGQEADRQRSQEAGFDHHLVKPADFGKLQQILETVSKAAN